MLHLDSYILGVKLLFFLCNKQSRITNYSTLVSTVPVTLYVSSSAIQFTTAGVCALLLDGLNKFLQKIISTNFDYKRCIIYSTNRYVYSSVVLGY